MRGLNQDQKKRKTKSICSVENRREDGQQTETENQLWNSHRVARIKTLALSFGKKYCTFFLLSYRFRCDRTVRNYKNVRS